MKNISQAALGVMAVLGFVASPALAQQAHHGTMTPDQHNQMMGKESAHGSKVTHATGIVKAVDRAKGTATIAHNPIASKKWPAMTMTFKASKTVLSKAKVGQRVKFSFSGEGSNYTLTKIARN